MTNEELLDALIAIVAPNGEPPLDGARSMQSLLRRVADANVIFPSMCANNMEAWNLVEELKKYRSRPGDSRE